MGGWAYARLGRSKDDRVIRVVPWLILSPHNSGLKVGMYTGIVSFLWDMFTQCEMFILSPV